MGKWYGAIGFGETVQTKPGVWEEQITEHMYYGDLERNLGRFQTTENLNDDITIANKLSIVSDPFAFQNFHHIKYVEFMGSKWKVTEVDVQYPRLYLSIGGVYNDGASSDESEI